MGRRIISVEECVGPPDGVEQQAHGPRCVEIGIHTGTEFLNHRGVESALSRHGCVVADGCLDRGGAEATGDTVESIQRRGGFGQQVRGDFSRGAIVGFQHQESVGATVDAFQQLRQ